MNELNPFNPSLQAVFSSRAYKAASKYQQDSRHLFYTLIHFSEHTAVLPVAYHYIQQHLIEANKHYPINFPEQYHPDNISVTFHTPLPDPGPVELNLNACLLQSSPLILTEPCWIPAISQAATSQSQTAIKLMAIYLGLTQGESYKPLYHSLLIRAGLAVPALHTWTFARQEQVSDCFFEFATLQLALAHFPRVFFPEILGFTLAYCQSHTQIEHCFPVQKLQANCSLVQFLTVRQKLLTAQIPYIIEAIKDYLQVFADRTDCLWPRIQTGFGLYKQQTERCYQHLKRQLESPLSSQQALAKVVLHKAPSAFGHHSKIHLAGRSLDDWFSQSPFDSENFLTALKHSSYINKQNPAYSPLLKLFDFNSPMFGVLSEPEKELLKTWVGSENSEIHSRDKPVTVMAEVKNLLPIDEKKCSPIITYVNINYSRLNTRELYYYLVNADLYPEVLATAKQKVQRVLKITKLLNRLPFKQYEHPVFEDYIDALYQREIKAYQPLKASPKLSRKAYLWGIEQFAPTILTDGCWLQHVNQLNHSNPAIAAILFKIYEDETGNGLLEQNHPFIYQQLLNSLNICVPPIHSREFIEYPGFIAGAFDIPVYLLAISKFPIAFLPELLGLNMAIELSGLGRVYMRLADELKFWGIDPAIVNIHISIDNVASGHTALAKKAIQLHLDEVFASHGEQEMQRHWRRIHTGYCSLQTAGRSFKSALIYRYLLKRMTDWPQSLLKIIT
ncbi:MAG: iron-containing redox enzyme family protein [Methylobacter sp.]|nr:iron-containing redox enzyme family protein [Methylobacter sp.]